MIIIKGQTQTTKQKTADEKTKVLNNFFRCLTMLEKTLERMARQRWYSENQYPKIYFESHFCHMLCPNVG